MQNAPALITAADLTTINVLAKTFFTSGLFTDTKSEAQAIVKIMAGRELGFGPFESMRDINLIQGKVAIASGAISARIKGSGKYDYKIVSLTDTSCEIEFLQDGKPLTPTSVFNAADAKAAGLLDRDMYKKYPRNMYFARALTNGARWHCAEVFGGAVYTPDELRGPDVDAAPIVQTRNLNHGGTYPAIKESDMIDATPEPVVEIISPEDNPWRYTLEGVENASGQKIPQACHPLFELPIAVLEKLLKPINANKITPIDRVRIEQALRNPDLMKEGALAFLEEEERKEFAQAELATAPVIA